MTHHRPCNCHTLFLSAGELRGAELHPFRQSHTFQHLPCPHQPVFLSHAGIEQRKRHIFQHGLAGQQVEILKDKADLLVADV